MATERCDPVQTGLAAPDHTAELAHLVDRLGARFGLRRVTRPVPQDSHIPEFAVAAMAAHVTREKFVIRHGVSLPRPEGERVGRGGYDVSVSHRRSPLIPPSPQRGEGVRGPASLIRAE